jgi:hypothetical protein
MNEGDILEYVLPAVERRMLKSLHLLISLAYEILRAIQR